MKARPLELVAAHPALQIFRALLFPGAELSASRQMRSQPAARKPARIKQNGPERWELSAQCPPSLIFVVDRLQCAPSLSDVGVMTAEQLIRVFERSTNTPCHVTIIFPFNFSKLYLRK